MTPAAGCAGPCAAPASARPRWRSRQAPRAPVRACRPPSRRRTAPRHRCAAQRLCGLLETREVERADRLADELAIAVGVERATDDTRRSLEREVGDLVANLLERACGLGRDLLARLLEPALPLGLGLLFHALLHRIARLAGLGEDLLRLTSGGTDELLVLLEEALRLVACVLGGLDRVGDRRLPLVEHALDRPECVLL